MIACHLLDTGYCLASEDHILQGGEHKTAEIHSLVALLHHPARGWMLFDTGYAPRMVAATRPWPYWLYAKATPFVAPPELAVAAQLPKFGLGINDIQHIVVSHFHADHVAGLIDFPNARIVCSRAGFEAVANLSGFGALRRAYIPALVPADFAARAALVHDFDSDPVPGLGPTHDLLGDGSIRLVRLPGHARGQIGALVQTDKGPVLLAADGAWYNRAIREVRPPAPLAALFVDDMAAALDTLKRLHDFAKARPDVTIVPTHCPEIYQRFVHGGG